RKPPRSSLADISSARGPTVSGQKPTLRSSRCSRRSATGRRLQRASGLPLGRPRCEQITVRAPWSCGTLKSARSRTRASARLRSRSESFAMGSAREAGEEVAHAAGVSPLVVVPSHDLHAAAADDFGELGVHNRRTLVAAEVAGDQFLLFVSQDAVHGPGGCGLKGAV